MIANNVQPSLWQQATGGIGRLWRMVVEPPPSVTDVTMRRQARLLVTCIFPVMVILMMMWTAGLLIIPDYQPPAIGLFTLGLLVACIVLVRTGRYTLGSMVYMTAVIVMPILAIILADRGLENIYFLLMAPVFASMFLTIRQSIVMTVVVIVGMILLPFISPSAFTALEEVVFPIFMFLILSTLLIVGMQHRNLIEQDRQAELRALNEQLEERVEERTAELVVAVEKAEQANRVKDQFLASMSHELRTPLNAIINFTQIMVMGVLGEISERQASTLNEVIGSAKHLLALINDILDISKIQAGMLNLFIEDNVNVNEILENVAETAKSLIKDKDKVTVIEDIDEALPVIVADRRRVQQILLNLISNAAKFTEAGSITVSAKQEADHIVFAVQDTGPGIKAEDMEKIFTPFEQTKTGTQSPEGTGLGLSITKSLVETHEGKLWVESEPGDGAGFFFTLPIHSTTLRKQIA